MVKKHSLKIVYIPSACPEDVCGEIPVRESIKDMGNVNLEFATYGVGEWDDRTFEDVDLVVVETVAGRYDTNSTLIDLVRLAEVKANVLLFDFRGSTYDKNILISMLPSYFDNGFWKWLESFANKSDVKAFREMLFPSSADRRPYRGFPDEDPLSYALRTYFAEHPTDEDDLASLFGKFKWCDSGTARADTVKRFLNEISGKARSLDDVIESIVKNLPINEVEAIILKQKLRQEFTVRKISDVTFDAGYTGSGVIKVANAAIKVDITKRLSKEYAFYQHVKGSDFDEFCPSLFGGSDYTEFEGIGFLPLTNLDFELIPGFMKANQKYGQLLVQNGKPLFKDHSINYNLFLMSLFHSSAMKFDERYRKPLGLASYEDLNGNPHHKTTEDPGINKEGEAYKRFIENQISNKDFVKVINNYNTMLEAFYVFGKLIIRDGDWKPDNLCNGNKVDFACIGHGLEIDELAFYLSESSLNVDFDGFKQRVNQYIEYRFMHDKEFGKRLIEYPFLFDQKMMKTAWLRQLVLRQSVMKKRDLMDDEKYQQRLYYKQRVEEIMEEGGFV